MIKLALHTSTPCSMHGGKMLPQTLDSAFALMTGRSSSFPDQGSMKGWHSGAQTEEEETWLLLLGRQRMAVDSAHSGGER